MNNMSWVNEQIAVSGAFKDKDIPRLKEQGITAVVDIRSERADNEMLLKKHGMDYLHVRVNDTFSPSFDQLTDIMDFVEPLLDRGRKVLIHCQNGAGRSPLAVVVVLVSRGMTTPDALHLMKRKHPKSGLTDNQRRFLDNQLGTFLKSRKKH
jgi:protein-tyrosine phosphatase